MAGGCHVKPEQMFNLIFSYYDQYLELLETDDAPAGAFALSGTAVPADEVWVVRFVTARNKITNPSQIRIGILEGATLYPFVEAVAPGANIFVELNGMLVLKEADKVRARFGGCVLGDDLEVNISGYKMKLTQ